MKQFFRLLFISFGLLFLMSMNAHTPTEVADNNPPITSTSFFSDHQAGLIHGAFTDALPIIKILPLLIEGKSTAHGQKEIITSTGIRNRLQFFQESFLQYSPAILQKKGFTFFFHLKRTIIS